MVRPHVIFLFQGTQVQGRSHLLLFSCGCWATLCLLCTVIEKIVADVCRFSLMLFLCLRAITHGDSWQPFSAVTQFVSVIVGGLHNYQILPCVFSYRRRPNVRRNVSLQTVSGSMSTHGTSCCSKTVLLLLLPDIIWTSLVLEMRGILQTCWRTSKNSSKEAWYTVV